MLFITHKLREVLVVADRITVLRRGKVVAAMPASGATEASIVALLLGSGEEADSASNATNRPSKRFPGARNVPSTTINAMRRFLIFAMQMCLTRPVACRSGYHADDLFSRSGRGRRGVG